MLDFNDVVEAIKAGRGFEDYPAPLGPDCREIDKYTNNPRFPGEMAYGNGPVLLGDFKINLPQSMIDAQKKSIRDALKLYMNPKHIGLFMCDFYRGNFLEELSFQRLDGYAYSPTDVDCIIYDDKFTLDLDGHERKSNNRTYYTFSELLIVDYVCNKVPDIKTTVLAYQAGFLAYLERLKSAIQLNEKQGLTIEEQKRGVLVIENISRLWSSANFLYELLPAICLTYYKRDQSLKLSPVTEDFERGFAFALRVGLFRHHMQAPDGEMRYFHCPATITIRSVASQELGQEVCGRDNNAFPAGRMLGSIYKAVSASRGPVSPVPQINGPQGVALPSFR